tara:strand:- start:2817 stop:3131 length:315 start_codon:yes stop_codon:yes gene_type:complete
MSQEYKYLTALAVVTRVLTPVLESPEKVDGIGEVELRMGNGCGYHGCRVSERVFRFLFAGKEVDHIEEDGGTTEYRTEVDGIRFYCWVFGDKKVCVKTTKAVTL